MHLFFSFWNTFFLNSYLEKPVFDIVDLVSFLCVSCCTPHSLILAFIYILYSMYMLIYIYNILYNKATTVGAERRKKSNLGKKKRNTQTCCITLEIDS